MGPMGKALGMGKKPMMGADEEEGEEYASPETDPLEEVEEPESTLPAGFESAFDEYSEAPSAQGLYDLIELCQGGKSGSPGLSLILGGKKK